MNRLSGSAKYYIPILSPLRKVKKPRMHSLPRFFGEFANLTIVAYSAGCKFNKCLILQIKTFRSGLKVGSFWYRKSGVKIYNNKNKIYFTTTKRNKIFNFLKNESNILESFIELLLSEKQNIGYVKSKKINKLLVLQKAKECGLSIPETIITNKKKFVKKNFIIKAISEGFSFYKHKKIYLTYTKKVMPNVLPKRFNISLFQNLIKKKFELRIFYLKERCYSMAIFSQNDAQTKVDFRQYNSETPNRTVPYKIPQKIETKIVKLMKKLKFNTGSLDFIVDTSGNYVFLEVNPSGQFGMTSKPCNYYLEKKVAQELMNYEK